MFFALMFSLLAGPVPPPLAVRPPWIDTLPQVPGRLYAMGIADLGSNEGQALTRASERARLEVVTRLRATVTGRTSVATRISEPAAAGGGFGERQVQDEVSISTQALDLPGLVVESTYIEDLKAPNPGRSAFALAYLDLAQARADLASRLARIRESRSRVGQEKSHKALWRLRALKVNLDRLEDAFSLLALTGTGQDLGPERQSERRALEGSLALLEKAELPPLDFSRITVGFRTNVELPLGIEAYLSAQIAGCGWVRRDLDPDLVLDLAFNAGAEGPAFIFADMDVYRGITYRMEACMRLLDGGGAPIGRPLTIRILQSASPEGMVEAFRQQFEHRLPRMVADLKREMR